MGMGAALPEFIKHVPAWRTLPVSWHNGKWVARLRQFTSENGELHLALAATLER
jgi:hypothetical protein